MTISESQMCVTVIITDKKPNLFERFLSRLCGQSWRKLSQTEVDRLHELAKSHALESKPPAIREKE